MKTPWIAVLLEVLAIVALVIAALIGLVALAGLSNRAPDGGSGGYVLMISWLAGSGVGLLAMSTLLRLLYGILLAVGGNPEVVRSSIGKMMENGRAENQARKAAETKRSGPRCCHPPE